ncbi:MAG: hypothetical protein ACI30R_07375 [Sodaliphilus sp.]
MYESLRGVEITKDEQGYEVRVNVFSTEADYKLFVKSIEALLSITDGRAYSGDNDEEEITNPRAYFSKEWIDSTMELDFHMMRSIIANGHQLTLSGLFCSMCVGAHMFLSFQISLCDDYDIKSFFSLQNYLRSMQWHCKELSDTSSHMVMPTPDGESHLSMSVITIKDGKVKDFDYVSWAALFAIIDLDSDEDAYRPLVIPFRQAWKLLSNPIFRRLDEYQYERTGTLTVDLLHEMMEIGRRLEPDDIHHEPTYPGTGYDKEQNTVILMWNPAISSVKMDDHLQSVEHMLAGYFNWSVWEYEKARCGDRFFLVRVGEGKTGIVMSGVFDSHPFQDTDWSGKDRRTFYMDMTPNVILDPEVAPMLTTEQLSEAMPDFNWNGGHSGQILSKKNARKLESLWRKYLKQVELQVDGKTLNVNRAITYLQM